ncbi:MAG: hypothetical protein QN194_16480 [Armatimonadota bacterium]|nr:hypothetical protein [Armatimonadota bacterium]
MDLQTIFQNPGAVPVSLPVRSHPEWRGRRLAEILQEPDGPAFLEYLANGGQAPFALKLAAALLVAQERGWLAAPASKPKPAAKPKSVQDGSLPFAKAWALARAFTGKRYSLPILEQILVRGGSDGTRYLTATNLEVRIDIRTSGDATGKAFILACKQDCLSSPTDIVPDPDDNRYAISKDSDGRVYRVAVMPNVSSVEFAMLGNQPCGRMVLGSVEAASLSEALKTVGPVAANDNYQEVLQHVLVRIRNGAIILVAADGYRLIASSPIPVEGWEGMEEDLLVHRDSVAPIVKALEALGGKPRLAIIRSVVQTWDKKSQHIQYIQFQWPHARVTVRLFTDRPFPQYENLIAPALRAHIGDLDWGQVMSLIRSARPKKGYDAKVRFRVESGTVTLAALRATDNGPVITEPVKVGQAHVEGEGNIWFNPALFVDLGATVEMRGTEDWEQGLGPTAFISTKYTFVLMPMAVEQR